MTDETTWARVDDYLTATLLPADPALDEVLRANADGGLPAIDVSPPQGMMLHLLARIMGARRVLEIGTLGGYSTIWLARALPPGGRVVTLEIDAKHAEVARENFRRAGVAETVELVLGPALDTLPRVAETAREPFDLVFIDADKGAIPQYVEWSLRMSRPGTLIIVDNVIRDGEVRDPESTDRSVRGVRAFFEMAAAHPRLLSTAIQTVAAKGYDGFSLSLVT